MIPPQQLCLTMGKPQSGHFVASNEDFPEFKLPKVVRAGVVGYLTIYHLMAAPTQDRVTQHTTTPLLCMRAKLRSGRMDVVPFVTHTPAIQFFISQPKMGRGKAFITTQHPCVSRKHPP